MVLRHSGLGPRRSPGGRGNDAEAPVLGSPSPTAITGNEREQEKPTRRLAISPPQVSFLNTPIPPCLSSHKVLGSQTGVVCCQSTYWMEFTPGTASPHRDKSSQRSSLACQSSNNAGPRGRGHTGVSGGFSAVSQAWHPPPQGQTTNKNNPALS